MKRQIWCVNQCNIIEFASLETAVEFALSFSDSPKGPLNIALVGNTVWGCREENLVRFNDLESAEEWADEFSTDGKEYAVGLATVFDNFLQ